MLPMGSKHNLLGFIKLQGKLIHGDSLDNTRQKIIPESVL